MAERSGCSGSVFTAHAKFCTSVYTRSAIIPSTNRGDQLGARCVTMPVSFSRLSTT